MRQLLQTGYMHNRLRMIVGSFLVKKSTLSTGTMVKHGSGIVWSMRILPIIVLVGSGLPAVVPMQLHISAFLIRLPGIKI